jgi:hypothetical protein
MLDREAIKSAADTLQIYLNPTNQLGGLPSSESAVYFRQFLQNNGLIINGGLPASQDSQLKICCILAYFTQLLGKPGDRECKEYWNWGKENKIPGAFLSASITIGNDFLEEWNNARQGMLARQQQPAITHLQTQTQIQASTPSNPFGNAALAINGPDEVVRHSSPEANKGQEIIDTINQSIPGDAVFELVSVTRGPRVDEIGLRQITRNPDGSRPRLVRPERLRELDETLRVYAYAGRPAIFPVDGKIVVQVARETFTPIPIENYLGKSKSSRWQGRCDRPLEIPVGIGTSNQSTSFKLDTHALIAGSTGGGKTSLQDSMLLFLIFTYAPHVLRVALVDVQGVNFIDYDGHPSLLGGRVLRTSEDISTAINHIYAEKDRREELFIDNHVRDFFAYNRGIYQAISQGTASQEDLLPFIVLMVDEQAEAFAMLGKPYVDSLCQIARAFRKFGIHLILATQRPSKEQGGAFPAELAANVPIRIALRTTDATNSEIVLGNGYKMAANLAGKGDGYLLAPEYPDPVRFQSFWADPERIVQQACKHLRFKRVGQYPEDLGQSSNIGVELFPVANEPENFMESSGNLYGNDGDPQIHQAILSFIQTSARTPSITSVCAHLKSLGLIAGTYDKQKSIVQPYAHLWGG